MRARKLLSKVPVCCYDFNLELQFEYDSIKRFCEEYTSFANGDITKRVQKGFFFEKWGVFAWIPSEQDRTSDIWYYREQFRISNAAHEYAIKRNHLPSTNQYWYDVGCHKARDIVMRDDPSWTGWTIPAWMRIQGQVIPPAEHMDDADHAHHHKPYEPKQDLPPQRNRIIVQYVELPSLEVKSSQSIMEFCHKNGISPSGKMTANMHNGHLFRHKSIYAWDRDAHTPDLDDVKAVWEKEKALIASTVKPGQPGYKEWARLRQYYKVNTSG